MSETLHTCPGCKTPNFTTKGLKAHRCKGPKATTKAAAVEITTEVPKDPAWDPIRKTTGELKLVGRLFLRGQVRLGMQLAASKKAHGVSQGKRPSTCPESGQVVSWDKRAMTETGYSRSAIYECMRLFEASKAKLKSTKKLELPGVAKKDAILIFQSESALTLTDEQWQQVDAIIGTLTTGETQASLMGELDLVPKKKPMPKGGQQQGSSSIESTAGQMALLFFSPVASSLINARTNPEYKKLLYSLPLESSADGQISLSTLQTELLATLADIEEVKSTTAKPANVRLVS